MPLSERSSVPLGRARDGWKPYVHPADVERVREALGDLVEKAADASEAMRLYNRNGLTWHQLDAAFARLDTAINGARPHAG